MKLNHSALPAALSLALVACSTTETAPEPPGPPSPFADGVRIEADGKPIEIPVGHLVPCALDWNVDGKKDLIVGQFAGGRIRYYPNQGTDIAPEFGDFSYLDAGGEEIHLPAG